VERPSSSQGRTILLVDDDPHVGRSVARRLRELSYDVSIATTFDEALRLAADLRPDDVLLDMWIPGGNGIALIEPMRRLNPGIRIVLFTAYPSIANTVEAIKLGADDYLPKPLSMEQLRKAFDPGERARGGDRPPGPNASRQGPAADEREPSTLSLARARWEYIHYVMRECGWNIAAAARRLRVHRQSLQRMLKKHPPK
jgi:two-component system response regulator RegA